MDARSYSYRSLKWKFTVCCITWTKYRTIFHSLFTEQIIVEKKKLLHFLQIPKSQSKNSWQFLAVKQISLSDWDTPFSSSQMIFQINIDSFHSWFYLKKKNVFMRCLGGNLHLFGFPKLKQRKTRRSKNQT